MKPKHLAILGIVALLLVGLVVLKEWSEQPPDIVQEAGLEPLVPEGITAGDFAKLELYKGDKPDAKVVLARSDDGTAWRVASQFDAPVDTKKIDDYLDKIASIKGEPRPVGEGEGVLAEYDLSDDKAFHVIGYKKGEDQPAAHILIGKEAGPQTVFARSQGANDVYQTDANLRREAGVYSAEAELKAENWLNKKILELTPENVTRLALNSPDNRLVLEKREKPAPEQPKPAEETPAEPAAETPPPAPSFQWAVAEGAPDGKPFKEASVDEYLQGFRSLYAADVADPAKLAEWGLDQPMYRTAITLKDQPEELVIEGGKPKAETEQDAGSMAGSGKGYIRLAGKEPAVVFEVTGMMFDRIFPKGSQFFTLADLQLDPSAIERVELTQPEGNAVFAKQDGAWVVESPKADLNPQSATLDTVASTLAGWNPEGFAASPEAAGLDSPARKVTFSAGPDKTHTIVLGNDAKSIEGAYARLDADNTTLLMAKDTVDKIFVAPKDLYERTLLEAMPQDIKAIAVTAPETAFEAVRKDDASNGWTLSANGAEAPAGTAALDNLASALTGLQASDILFDQAQLPADPMATVRFTLNDQEQTLSIGPAGEGGMHPATLSGKQNVFLLAEADVKTLLPAVDALKPGLADEAGPPDGPAPMPMFPSMPGEMPPGAPMMPMPMAPAPGPIAAPEAPAPVEPVPLDAAPEAPATEAAPEAAPAEPAPAEPVPEATATEPAPEAPAAPDAAPAEPAPAPETPAPTEPAPAPAEGS